MEKTKRKSAQAQEAVSAKKETASKKKIVASKEKEPVAKKVVEVKTPAPKSPAVRVQAKNQPAKKSSSNNTIQDGKVIVIKQIHSGAGRLKSQIATLKGLRLNKIGRVSTLQDTPAVRGMVKAVSHLIEIIKG